MDDSMPAARPQNAVFEHERLRSLINSMADGVVAIDQDCKIVLYNGAALNILDLNASVQGKTVTRIIKLIDKNNQPIDVRKLILGTKTSTITRDYRVHYPDGSMINLYLSIAPVHHGYESEGELSGYVLLLRDITREKSLEEERDEFISVASHELRTPITVAEGNLSNALFIVQQTAGASQDILDALTEAHNQIAYLASLINDLATLSRADRGKLHMEVGAINIHNLVLELAKSYTPEAAKKGLKIHTHVDPALEMLKSSHLYVREVMQNFITNSIKYTEHGSVTIGATQ
jgi:PAS domain S-box-containing protein